VIREEDIKHASRPKELKKVFASNAEETLPPEWKELLSEEEKMSDEEEYKKLKESIVKQILWEKFNGYL